MRFRFFGYKIFPLWVLLFGLLQIFGQAENGYRFVTYSNQEGFNQNTVMSIEQDKTGTLWVGCKKIESI
jgi:hypothetical protein